MPSIGVNTTHTERVRRLNEQLSAKIRLERFLFNDLMQIYGHISSRAARLYAASGEIIDMDQFKPVIRASLIRQYKRVFREFPLQISTNTDLSQKQVRPGQDEIQQQQDEYIADRSAVSAQQMADTTQKRWDDAIEAAILALLLLRPSRGRIPGPLEDDRPLTFRPDGTVIRPPLEDPLLIVAPREVITDPVTGEPVDLSTRANRTKIATDARKTFDAKSPTRSRTAATTETQSASETNKNIVSVTLLTIANVLASASKVWMTILDGRERASHGAANNQRVFIHQPYIVQGQQLMFPGDIDLGATADNVVNCRCASMIVMV